ncbi:MAG: 30S ribosomal protein S12 methylthiotransferase RimO [Bdellovibrionales bacterium]|nr:30S ribosomal protein S12 methylthiotransferase RimO [Bdellovibrionales bacterium]
MSRLTIVGQHEKQTKGKPLSAKSFKGSAAVITLGCAKNQVDSEVMQGVLATHGYRLVGDVENADVAIVNTCGFLESSTKESLDCILDVAELKESGRLKRLIVSGCLVDRYRGDLQEELPEVDAFVSSHDLLRIEEAVRGAFVQTLEDAERPYFLYDESAPRVLSGSTLSAYVKISEGCDRPCSFCIIPKIRGAFRSRSIGSVCEEVRELGAVGVREVNLVGQDLTAFDDQGRSKNALPMLLEALNNDGAVDWIRLLYAYPLGISPELLNSIVDLPRICTYLDLPLQHVSTEILRAMKRPMGKYATRELVERIATLAPTIALRTTFIVGFPGETEREIQELETFVAQGFFSSVGVFCYSPEPGTPAATLEGQIDPEVQNERRSRILRVQQEVVQHRMSRLIGSTLSVLVEGPSPESDLFLQGRAEFQAPDVDGVVLINDLPSELTRDAAVGQIVNAEVSEIAGYDLVAGVAECGACA